MTGPQPGYRPCVGVMLLDRSGRVFVGERIGTPGAWQMPQGGIDDGETPLKAARAQGGGRYRQGRASGRERRLDFL